MVAKNSYCIAKDCYFTSCCLVSRILLDEFDVLEEKTFENILGKGENAAYQHFLFFPQCFLLHERQIDCLV